MSPEARDSGLLRDIVACARKASLYASDLAEEQFLLDELRQDAVVRNLEIIGEAAILVSAASKSAIDLPWNDIIRQRHLAIHHYDKVNMRRIWATVRDDLQPLIEAIEQYLLTIE